MTTYQTPVSSWRFNALLLPLLAVLAGFYPQIQIWRSDEGQILSSFPIFRKTSGGGSIESPLELHGRRRAQTTSLRRNATINTARKKKA